MAVRPLRVLHWNANGLHKKTVLLKPLLRDQDIDVVLINETHLRPADKCKLPGYIVYRQDEVSATNTAYRGLLVAIRRRILHQILPSQQLGSMHALGVEVCVADNPLRLFAAYRPPRAHFDVADVRTLLDSPHPTLIAGDMNSKHSSWNPSSAENTAGRRLFNDAQSHGYIAEGPDAPTRYPSEAAHAPATLDIIIHRGLPSQPTQEVLNDELLSDHQPVLVVIPDPVTRVNPPRPRYKVDWNIFTEALETNTPSRAIINATDVDQLADDLTTRLQEAFDAAKSPITIVSRIPDIPRRIRDLIDQKRRDRTLWQQTRCPQLKTRLNRLAEKVKAELEAHNTQSWEDYIDTTTDDWPALHRLCRNVTNTPDPVRPLLHNDGTQRYRAEDRAEIFAEHLERQFQPNPSTNSSQEASIERRLEEYFAEPITPDEDPIFFSPGQVRMAIRRTKPRKAPGDDGITNSALRHLPHKTVAALTRLFNGIMRTGHFPQRWKSGRVIMLPKAKKNVLKPESYRPITLLPTTSKVFEFLLLRHLVSPLTPRQEQYGFRAGHSTTLQLTRVLHHLTTARNNSECTISVFLDMEKAFDRVWHQGLVYKVSTSDAPRRITRLIQSFLKDRRFHVMVEGALSQERPVAAGVPQGSCLSPILYSRYTDDIPVVDDVQIALYADDTAYFVSSPSARFAATKIQRTLDRLPEWLAAWRMSVNVGKTQAMQSRGTKKAIKPAKPLRLFDQEIPWAPKVKYLGVTIDKNLRMSQHVKEIIHRSTIAMTKLRPILQSKIPLRAKIGVYKLYIRSRLTYAAPAWFALTGPAFRKRLRCVQSKTLRTIVGAPHYVRNSTIQRDLRMDSLDDFVQRLAKRMFERADASPWPHLQNLAPLHARPPDGKPLPRDLLA